MTTTTYHDATADGHRRVLIAVWDHDAGHDFGAQIERPSDLDAWVEYTAGRKGDAAFYVMSPSGD